MLNPASSSTATTVPISLDNGGSVCDDGSDGEDDGDDDEDTVIVATVLAVAVVGGVEGGVAAAALLYWCKIWDNELTELLRPRGAPPPTVPPTSATTKPT